MDKDYLAPYRTMVDKIGPRFESLLWTREETQTARFLVFSEMCDLTGRVIADAGCGRGDLAVWMHDAGIAYGEYIGIEALPELLDVARSRAGDRSSAVAGDFVEDTELFGRLTPRPDVIYFSGSLNTLDPERTDRVLQSAWDACGDALCFNFLSDRNHGAGSDDLGPARRFDTASMIAWALDRTSLVAFRQDYLGGNDATICMRKRR